jgi:hypothetical protein
MTCAARCAALSSSALIRQDILPLTIGYALLMIALATGLLMSRRTTRNAVPGSAPDVNNEQSAAEAESRPGVVKPGRYAWLRLIRQLGITFVGGYLLLMVVLIAYYYGVAPVSGNFIESGFTGCAMLIGLSLPVFLAATWLLDRRRARAAAAKGRSR